MHAVIWFKTGSLDVKNEPENPINPIMGASLLTWIQEKEKGKISVPEPECEDWGWYANINFNGRSYMLGASTEEVDEHGQYQFCFQVEKHRTLKEKILRRERATGDTDPCYQYFKQLFESEPSFVEFEYEP